jgi:hypothetical protein
VEGPILVESVLEVEAMIAKYEAEHVPAMDKVSEDYVGKRDLDVVKAGTPEAEPCWVGSWSWV